MKKVLIITYYWPPMGGGGVQRWLKFVKYLRRYGWEPVVFTTEGANASIPDESLEKDVPHDLRVIRCPIREPYAIYNRLMGKKKGEGFHAGFVDKEGGKENTLATRIAMWVRGTFFIPDAKMLWIRPATKMISKFLRKESIDAIVSSGPPHTTHMIALNVNSRTGIPWMADFRDPWTNIDFFHHLGLNKWAHARHKKLEKQVLRNADQLVTVSWSWAEDFKEIEDRSVKVIPNGYDPADFENKGDLPLSEDFSIIHAGSFNKDRNPEGLWEALGELAKADARLKEKLRIELIGPTDHAVKKAIEENGMGMALDITDDLDHDKVIERLCRSRVLLLPLNDTPNVQGVIPGKLYEYLGAKRPILCTGPPEGDTGRIIRETNAGHVVDIHDKAGLKAALQTLFEAYLEGKDSEQPSSGIERYTRPNLAGEVAAVLDGITEQEPSR